jgi:membrane dipeptidase
VSDEILKLLKKNGGVIMICFLRELVDPAGGAKATMEQVVDHILYAAEMIGFDYIGIGSDFDGMLEGPSGLDDVSQYPDLVAELLRRGVSEDHVRGILSLNILRVLKEVEYAAFREQLMDSSDVLCDNIVSMWTPEQREILLARGRKRNLDQRPNGHESSKDVE